MTARLDVNEVRERFPALSRTESGRPVAYLDGPGGTQTPQVVIDAISNVLGEGVSNLGGGFGASDDAEEVTALGRKAMADFINASPEEISFGQNMTSLTFSVSRALARTWSEDDAIVVTSLDHDANYTPWVTAASEAGVEIRVAEFDTATGSLVTDAIVALLDDRVRLVAVCLASNALGTLVDVPTISAAAHEVGALVYVDAVHAGPHHRIDVETLDCDFLVCSAYKFFGPHTGILYGKLEHMASLDAYKLRPAPSDPPGKWETGTQSFESIAGVTAAVDYIANISGPSANRREGLDQSFQAISQYETGLSKGFLDGIAKLDRVRLVGPPKAGSSRVSTFAIDVDGVGADAVAKRLVTRGLYVWSGHYYAVNVMDRLDVLDTGGLVRIGFVHYNTKTEVDRVLEALAEF
jgi:cysteine desulfurase family protein (TIGR01976 family)